VPIFLDGAAMALKMNEPIGNPIYGPLFVRMALGSYFIIAGLMKLDNFAAFIAEVEKFNILPKHVAVLYGTLLPYLEIGGGMLVLVGFWTTMAALLCALLLTSFIIALRVFPNASYLFNKDVILLAAAVSLMYSGAGAFSVDRFRRGQG